MVDWSLGVQQQFIVHGIAGFGNLSVLCLTAPACVFSPIWDIVVREWKYDPDISKRKYLSFIWRQESHWDILFKWHGVVSKPRDQSYWTRSCLLLKLWVKVPTLLLSGENVVLHAQYCQANISIPDYCSLCVAHPRSHWNPRTAARFTYTSVQAYCVSKAFACISKSKGQQGRFRCMMFPSLETQAIAQLPMSTQNDNTRASMLEDCMFPWHMPNHDHCASSLLVTWCSHDVER